MASFLNEIREQSLESLEIFSISNVGPKSFLVLNCHRDSLTKLHLHSISADAMVTLNLLKECTNIISLQLSESRASTTDLEHRHNDVFLEVIGWLTECKRLKSIKLKDIFSAPSLLTPILLEHDIRLIELELDEYTMTVGKNVHRALVHQPSLQSLFLKGEGDDTGTDGYNILAGSLSKLENLTVLRLQNISDYFNNEHICLLAQSLPKLESFATTGWDITDEVWRDLARLENLKQLQFNGKTCFTAKGLLGYVRGLGPGNEGFELAVMMADMESELKPHEEQLIRDTLTKRVGGSFNFMLLRGIPLWSYFKSGTNHGQILRYQNSKIATQIDRVSPGER